MSRKILWSDDECVALLNRWHEVSADELCAILRRTWHAIRLKAIEMHLPLGPPTGYVSMRVASRALRIDARKLRPLLIAHAPTALRKAYPLRIENPSRLWVHLDTASAALHAAGHLRAK